MIVELPYGCREQLSLNVPDESLVASHTVARGAPLDDPAAAVAAALDSPLDFPPIHAATVPGDRIAVALEPGLPQAEAIVAGVVHTLLQGTVEPHDIVIVASAEDGVDAIRERLVSLLPEEIRDQVDVVVHGPSDQQQLAYLAASREGKPIYLSRTLCDADVVIPIGLLRLEKSLAYVGVHGGLFPTFSDEATQSRFRAPSSSNWEALRRRRMEEAAEAAWMLGCQFTVQVVPGPGHSLLHVLAGDSHSVERQGRELCAAAWQFESRQRANLVLVSIEGGPEQQTWDNVARALFAASQAVEENGAIVVCSAVSQRPGPALRQLASMKGNDQLKHEMMRQTSIDALPAKLLLELQETTRVYLLSELPRDEVENLGIGHVERAADVERLLGQFDSCIVLANAHRALISTPSEPQSV